MRGVNDSICMCVLQEGLRVQDGTHCILSQNPYRNKKTVVFVLNLFNNKTNTNNGKHTNNTNSNNNLNNRNNNNNNNQNHKYV